MDQAEIEKLGELARVALTPEEVAKLSTEIPSILEYVSAINTIAAGDTSTKQVGARFNVLRDDVVTNEPETHTDALLAEMPSTDGRYMKVKKILQQD